MLFQQSVSYFCIQMSFPQIINNYYSSKFGDYLLSIILNLNNAIYSFYPQLTSPNKRIYKQNFYFYLIEQIPFGNLSINQDILGFSFLILREKMN